MTRALQQLSRPNAAVARLCAAMNILRPVGAKTSSGNGHLYCQVEILYIFDHSIYMLFFMDNIDNMLYILWVP